MALEDKARKEPEKNRKGDRFEDRPLQRKAPPTWSRRRYEEGKEGRAQLFEAQGKPCCASMREKQDGKIFPL